MKSFKQLAFVTLAFIAGTASAANISQPFTATNATLTINTSVLTTNNLTGSAVGAGTTFNPTTGLLTTPVVGVSIPTDPGALVIQFGSTAGLQLTTPGLFGPIVAATLQNFTFDLSTNILHGDLLTAAGNVLNQDLLQAGTVSSSFGGVSGTNIASSSTARTLGLAAGNFTLAPSLVSLLGANAGKFTFVADSISSLNIGTVSITPAVPEPSTYALMAVGLVGIGLMRGRRAN